MLKRALRPRQKLVVSRLMPSSEPSSRLKPLRRSPVKSIQALPSEGEDLDRAIDELFDTVQVPPGVGKGAMRRENWYR